MKSKHPPLPFPLFPLPKGTSGGAVLTASGYLLGMIICNMTMGQKEEKEEKNEGNGRGRGRGTGWGGGRGGRGGGRRGGGEVFPELNFGVAVGCLGGVRRFLDGGDVSNLRELETIGQGSFFENIWEKWEGMPLLPPPEVRYGQKFQEYVQKMKANL